MDKEESRLAAVPRQDLTWKPPPVAQTTACVGAAWIAAMQGAKSGGGTAPVITALAPLEALR